MNIKKQTKKRKSFLFYPMLNLLQMQKLKEKEYFKIEETILQFEKIVKKSKS